MLSNRERMLAGEFYDSRDPELITMAHRARALLRRFAVLPSEDHSARTAVLHELVGSAGEGVWIEPPFFCAYGAHVSIGTNTFVNVNCIFLDAARIDIGSNGLVGPAVQLLTATHPIRASERIVRHPHDGGAPYRTRAAPIRIGDNVWLGGGVVVMPGITIGDNVTIGAGSVVTHNVASDTVAYGNPCRVQRSV